MLELHGQSVSNFDALTLYRGSGGQKYPPLLLTAIIQRVIVSTVEFLVNVMARKRKEQWWTLFAYADLYAIEDMYLIDDYDVDRIYEEMFPYFKDSIENEEITGDDLYRCIKDYIRDMPWKKCQ